MQKLMQIKVSDLYIYILGDALQYIDKFDDAIKMYDRALKINPNFQYAYLNKGL